MKNYTLIFLALTVITGLIGFTGMNFFGIPAVRVLFVIFADLLVISVLAKIFFPATENMKLQRVKK
ncbi:hypothetical protein SAMN04487764_1696 [Gillisia sp. Hel1_33_143]|uniref:DUF1328 domain-containing protein n=1 Tax=Gillisia sp. Hel1_33_143 TaxID=1336796 RepID=UPI00087CF830|nr:DUF1328 domain-containing protein [Gillisia sp. Hel1_33_143]SDS20828.1 hypothetical protein SAMN04487764_1696 [Gillisia sp. Hel1_33_143]